MATRNDRVRPLRLKEDPMPSWLLILLIGVVLVIVGFSGVGSFLIWIGIAVLVVSLVLALVGRGKSSRI